MKSTKLLSLILVAVLLTLSLVGCGGGNDPATTTLPPALSIKVNIQVINGSGETIIDVKDYVYTSATVAPTPFSVLDDYCYMNLENTSVVKDELNGALVSVGKVVAKDGESYWDVTLNGKSVNFSEATVAEGDTIVCKLVSLG